MQKQWEINLDGVEHVIVYQGNKFSGQFKVLVDGEYNEYMPSLVKKVGLFAKLNVDGKEVLLKVSLDGKNTYLVVDGVYIEDNSPKSKPVGQNELLQKLTGYKALFLLLIICTYANLVSIILDFSTGYRFSAVVPQISLFLGQRMYEEEGIFVFYLIGVIFSILFASVYVLLYILFRKSVVSVIIALILIIIDTAVLVFLGYNNMSEFLIDLLFHCALIWSLAQLIINRNHLTELEKTQWYR